MMKLHSALRTIGTSLVLVALVGIPALSSFGTHASALTNPLAWQAGRIMDDAIFYNSGDMDVSQVQSFLNSKVPTCDTMGTQTSEYGGGTRAQYGIAHGAAPPYICLKDYVENPTTHANNLNGVIPSGGLSSAQIIVNAAQTYGVSVKVLLTILQKESVGPLVTDTWPFPSQYTNAMGYGCPDTASCDPQYAGFYNQVTNAARQFSLYKAHPANYRYLPLQNNSILYSPNGACGNSTVYLQSYATAGLYNYTPYQPNQAALNNLYGSGDACSSYGNRNFWRMFNDWFGTTLASPLIRGSSPTVYVQGTDSNTAYGVPTGAVLDAYGLGGMSITNVSDAYIASLNTSTMLTTLFMKPGDGTIYLADSGKMYGISSGTICTQWSLPCGQSNLIATLPDSITHNMSVQPALGNLMLSGGVTYYMDSGKKRPFLASSDVSLSPWKDEQVTRINSPLNATQLIGLPELYASHFIGISSSGSIDYYDAPLSQYFTFASFAGFKSWWDKSTVLPDLSSFPAPPTATTMPTFVTSGGQVYMVAENNKFALDNNVSGSLSAPSITGIDGLLSAKPTITVDNTKAYGLPGGTIVTYSSGQLRPIPTMFDLSLLGFDPANVVPTPLDILQAYPVGKLTVPSGRLIGPPNSPAFYMYGDDHNLWALGELSQLQYLLPEQNALSIYQSDIDSGSILIYRGVVRNGGTYYAIQPDGRKRPLPAAALSTDKDNIATPISGSIFNRIGTDGRGISFIRLSNGTIFAVQGSQLRPISSFGTYLSMGGNADNTAYLPQSALGIFIVGSPI